MSLRIVQLSDLHLGSRIGDARWTAFERLLNDLPRLTDGFDRLVITGDVAAHGQPSVYPALRERLTPLLENVLVIPGNHDTKQALRASFAERMCADWSGANFLEDVGGLRLVGLDSSRPWRTSGALGREQLAWLSGVLGPEVPALLFLHHPPVPIGTWWLDKDCLRDRRELEGIVSSRRVLGIFCGHVHQEFEGALGSVPVWTTPSTAYQFKAGSFFPRTEPAPASVRMIEITRGVLRTRTLRNTVAPS